MRERGPENQKSIEIFFASLQEAIQPVISGDRERIDIIGIFFNPFEGTTNHFFPVPRVFGEEGGRVFERLKKELECDTTFNKQMELVKEGKMDEGHNCRTWSFDTNLGGIVLEKTETFDRTRSLTDPERIIWSIRNLHPKTKGQKLGERMRRFRKRA